MNRKPSVAGAFYPNDKNILTSTLSNLIDLKEKKQKVTGLISPHAGYVYSGQCAGKGFGRIEIPGTVIILGVNHRGSGSSLAVDGHDGWSTPLGVVELNKQMREELIRISPFFEIDSEAGLYEHSLEVQVPFIQYLRPSARILAVTVSSNNIAELLEAGKAIAELIRSDPDTMMLASTDMSHYMSAEAAQEMDKLAIDKILSMDAAGLFETVKKNAISMCGVSPTVILLSAARELGVATVEQVAYTNSGETSGDFSEVVAYFSALIY